MYSNVKENINFLLSCLPNKEQLYEIFTTSSHCFVKFSLYNLVFTILVLAIIEPSHKKTYFLLLTAFLLITSVCCLEQGFFVIGLLGMCLFFACSKIIDPLVQDIFKIKSTQTYTHLKTGEKYKYLFAAIAKSDIRENEEVEIYEKDGQKYVRSKENFDDTFKKIN